VLLLLLLLPPPLSVASINAPLKTNAN